MIVTCKKEVPFHWMLLALIPWSAVTINTQITQNVVVFSLKKFLENPATLTFILSLPSFLSLVVITLTNLLSDRIWTRFGRRKPFIVTGFAGSAVCLLLMPLMPNFWSLVLVYILLGIFVDINSPIEPLKQEVVPPHQRGRATGIMYWINQAAVLIFMFFVFGRFDDVRFMAGFAITGEEGIYWSSALIAVSMIMLVSLGIKEVRLGPSLKIEKITIKTFFGGLLDREILPVYILITGYAILQTGTGPMGALLYTVQWGYTKQDMGTNIAIGGALNLVLIAILTIFADKMNRLRAYQNLIIIAVTLNIVNYCYIKFVLPDQRPTLFEIVLFGEMMSVVGILTGLIYTPMIYDYVVRNKMGTYVAGAKLVTRLTEIVILNGVGLFVVFYAALFQPPAGEMMRVVLREPASAAEVRSWFQSIILTNPATKQNAVDRDLSISIWNADGTTGSVGRGIELRFKNQSSESTEAERRALEDRLHPLLESQQLLGDRADLARDAGRIDEATKFNAEKMSLAPKVKEIEAKIGFCRDTLLARAQNFHDQAIVVLQPHLVEEGSQIRQVESARLLVLNLQANQPISRDVLDRLLIEGRAQMVDLVDLVMGTNRDSLRLCLLRHPEIPASDQVVQDVENFKKVTKAIDSRIMVQVGNLDEIEDIPGVRLILATVESPLPKRISPISGAIQMIERFLGYRWAPDARLLAAARALHKPGETQYAGARAGADGRNEVEITMSVEMGAVTSPTKDAIYDRLVGFASRGQKEPLRPDVLRELYDRVVASLAKQRLTVCEPVLTAEYAPVKYDYLAGNLLTIGLGFIGYGITMIFYYLERKGFIQKRGIQEAEATL